MKPPLILLLILTLLLASSVFAQTHIVIGWNDLGMHCSNKDFSTFVVLPPFNNIHAQVIQVGDINNLPVVVTANMRVTYEIPGNTYSVGKTNFWDYVFPIFGVNLAPNIGLTGAGLTGDMAVNENYFYVRGVPITPYTDADLLNEDPFQLGLLKLYDQSDQLLATTQAVVPVSNEINCVSSGCHTSAMAILYQHGPEAGFDPNSKPILCANCHASNALGMPGNPNLPSLSQAVHEHHGGITNDCYKCHPGPNTQCLRDIMSTKHGFVCRDCHGSVSQVGESIGNGRIPWLQEPSCGAVTTCHGPNYAEEPGKLFRESRGHGNLFCSACHGEPHAIVTSRVARDNVQNIALQGHAGTLDKCIVCHGIVPSGPGPHGILVSACCLHPGDVNHNGIINIQDVTYLIAFLYRNGPQPICQGGPGKYPEADANGNGIVNIQDVSSLIKFLYMGGAGPICGPE
jgi:Dockerin type I domain